MNKIIKNGDMFYDNKEDRYLTVDGFGCDPNVCACVIRERVFFNEDDYDLEITGRQLFTKYELSRMEKL